MLSHATNPRKLAEDLRRSAYVMAGAAIDTYFHQRIFKEATIAPITKKASEVGIRLRDVDHIIETKLPRCDERPTQGDTQTQSTRTGSLTKEIL